TSRAGLSETGSGGGLPSLRARPSRRSRSMFQHLLPASLLLGLLLGALPCQAAISDAEAVNRAGLQRMLGQRIARSYLMLGTETRTELAQAQLDSSIASVEENSQLLGDYAPSAAIRNAVGEAGLTWQQFRE